MTLLLGAFLRAVAAQHKVLPHTPLLQRFGLGPMALLMPLVPLSWLREANGREALGSFLGRT